EATRLHFEGIDAQRGERATFRCGIGFADLSGFTRLSQERSFAELSSVLTTFEEGATEVVQEHGGRTVKFLGDAVMWVCADPDRLVATAHALISHRKALEAGIGVRAGVAHGQVLVQDGDYFGTPVNLASRLVAVAQPGQVLAGEELVALLGDDWLAVPGEPQVLRGFEAPLTPYALHAR
ncbi:MAG: adenylate/guanylate cyclase domain-containing protein, partial [Mycobacteriales bacterium]